jgi:hypothetical protein
VVKGAGRWVYQGGILLEHVIWSNIIARYLLEEHNCSKEMVDPSAKVFMARYDAECGGSINRIPTYLIENSRSIFPPLPLWLKKKENSPGFKARKREHIHPSSPNRVILKVLFVSLQEWCDY